MGSASVTANSTGLTTRGPDDTAAKLRHSNECLCRSLRRNALRHKGARTLPSTVAFGVNNRRLRTWVCQIFQRPGETTGERRSSRWDCGRGRRPRHSACSLPAYRSDAILGNPGVPGLAMTSDDGATAPQFPGSMGGTISRRFRDRGAWTTGPVVASRNVYSEPVAVAGFPLM